MKEVVKGFGAPKVLAMNLENGEEYVGGKSSALFLEDR